MDLDDALDVWGVHGVGGVIGTILLGVFASSAINGMVPEDAQGLVFGGGSFFVKQIVAVVAASAYAFIFTYLMLVIINFITPVKLSENVEKSGLDESLHGEQAYQEGAL